MATRADDLATTFRTWAATGEVALHRTAYLLTGDLATARLQVRDALGAALATRPGDPADLDEAALRALLGNRASTGSDLMLADSDDVGVEAAAARRVGLPVDAGPRGPWRAGARLPRGPRRRRGGGAAGADRARGDRTQRRRARGPRRAAAPASSGHRGAAPGDARGPCRGDEGGAAHLQRGHGGLPPAPGARSPDPRPGGRRRRGGGARAGGRPVGRRPPEPSRARPAEPGPVERHPARRPGAAAVGAAPGAEAQRVELETRCSNPSDQEFRSITTIQSGCRTYVLEDR